MAGSAMLLVVWVLRRHFTAVFPWLVFFWRLRREIGFHWHFWHVVLACVPGALVALFASRVEPDTTLKWTMNNMSLQGRIDELEQAMLDMRDRDPGVAAKEGLGGDVAGLRSGPPAAPPAAPPSASTSASPPHVTADDKVDADEAQEQLARRLADLEQQVRRLSDVLAAKDAAGRPPQPPPPPLPAEPPAPTSHP